MHQQLRLKITGFLCFISLLMGVDMMGQGSESFTNIPASSGSYATRTWTGDNSVGWSATDSRTDQTLTGKAICVRTGEVTNTTTISGGVGTLSFKYKMAFSGGSTLKVFVNDVQYGSDIIVNSTTAATFSQIINVTGNVNIRLVNTGQRTTIDDLAWSGYSVATPSVTTNVTSLANFGSVNVGAESASSSFTVSGSLLTANAVITAPSADFRVSLDDITFSGSVQIPFGDGTLTNVPVYVKFTPQSAGAKSGDVTISSTGAANKTVSVSGTGVSIAPTASLSGTLNEATLNTASFTITLANDTFAENPLTTAAFTLNNAPAGVTLANVTYVNATTATAELAYSDIDFDANVTNMNVTIAASQLASAADLISGDITVTAVAETLLSAGTLAFGNVCINTTSDSGFTLTGTVKAGTLELTAATGYTFSLTDGNGYTSTLSFPVSAGSLNETIYVRFAPTAVQAYDFSTTISGGAASNLVKAITGSGIDTQAAITTATATAVTATGVTLRGTVTTLGVCPASVERGFVYSVTATNAAPEADGTGVTKVTVAGLNTSQYTYDATGLSPSTEYTVRAYVYNGITYTYGAAQTFSTTAPPPVNDLCADAVALTVDAAPVGGTLVSATYTALSNGNNQKDVWYTFTASCTGDHVITMTAPTEDNDVEMFLFSGSCPANNNTNIGSAETTNNPEVITEYLTAGVIYTIRVSAYDISGESPFTIGVTSVLSGANVTAAAATSISSDGATIPVTVVAGCQTTTGVRGIVYGTSQNPTIENGTNITSGSGNGNFDVGITGLTDNTLYYVRAYAISDGVTTYSTQISFTTSVINAPLALEETGLAQPGAGFTALWEAVEGATGYRLDVSESLNFGSEAPAVFTEGFEGTTFPPSGWIRTGTNWVRSTDAADIKNGDGAASATAVNGSLTTPAISKPSSLSFYLGRSSNATAKTLTIEVSTTSQTSGFTTIETYTHSNVPSGSYNQYTVDLSGYSSEETVYIRFTKASSTTSPWRLDDVAVSYTTLAPSYVAGYENKAVTSTYEDVTGLTLGNTYYYRVRAESAASTSANSNVITALAVESNIWDNQVWSLGTPTDSQTVVIADDYNTDTNNSFESGTLIVDSGVLTVAAGTTITVQDAIINNATAENFIVEDGAALIQVNDIDNTGGITVNKESNILYKLDYSVWSSPVTGQTLGNFSPLTHPTRFYTYGVVNGVEDYISQSPSVIFQEGTGYLIRMPHHLPQGDPNYQDYEDGNYSMALLGRFRGTPNNGLVEVPVSTQLNNVSMIGNPYPSPINVVEFFNQNSGVLMPGQGLQFWRKRNNQAATSFASLTTTMYTANDGGAESGEEPGTYNYGGQVWEDYFESDPSTWVIAPGQGFYVTANGNAGNVVFTNEMRSPAGTGQPFFRMNNNDVIPALSRIWLNLYSDTNFSQAGIAYTDTGTLGIDYGMDARRFNANAALSLYSVMDSDNFTIQTRPAFDIQDEVAIGYTVGASGTYKIAVHSKDGVFAAGQNIYLKDNYLNLVHDFSDGQYAFGTEAGTFNDRFDVIYSNEVLAINNPENALNAVVIYKQDNMLNVHAGTSEITDIMVYDLRGRILYSKNDIYTTEANINMQPQQQVLLIEITTAVGKVTKKVVY